MTCIVGVQGEDGRVYIGGDSAGVAGWSVTPRADLKVFTRQGYAFGFTSSFRMGQLLRYDLDLPDAPGPATDLDRFMVQHFIPAVRECLKGGGYAKVENGVEQGGAFLVGVRGALYSVASDFQVGRSRFGFEALGCGKDEAGGALYVLHGRPLHPEAIVFRALDASAALNAGVCEPFEVVSA